MHHIIYLSLAVKPFTSEQLEKLLAVARRRNTELAITGILFYGNERFLQVLEGEEEAVRAVYASIKRDPRHQNIITYANKPITQRAFTLP
ncbi:MAG: BLUF domain-containing protein [Hymenobacter sp.]|nr:MAG: BLUF domain-containing protein [Hymenobacter sp.]